VVIFTFETLAVVTLLYLALIPVSVRRYRALDRDWKASLAQKAGEGGGNP
jgi:CDP-diacylglycerol--serine O-phosphatidyltransferase